MSTSIHESIQKAAGGLVDDIFAALREHAITDLGVRNSVLARVQKWVDGFAKVGATQAAAPVPALPVIRIVTVGKTTTIEWTDATWNPVRGCTKISPGCIHCYAATFAERFRGVPGHPYEQGFDLRLVPEALAKPLRWVRSKMIFVNSMSDLFQEGVGDDYVTNVCEVMGLANWHTYQLLTKRHERMRDMLQGPLAKYAAMPHIWWGVSVENKRHGLPRVEALRDTPAAVRFLSIEPLLEDLGDFSLDGIHWVIVGGESGHGARPMERTWVEKIRRQCEDAGVKFFFKQWGGRNKKAAGRNLDGRTYDAMPEVPVASVPPRRERAKMIEGLSLRVVA